MSSPALNKRSQRDRRIRITVCLPPSIVASVDRQAYLSDLSRSRYTERLILSGMKFALAENAEVKKEITDEF
jgi:hypothetical protein